MQKIRLDLSQLSPHSIDCLSEAILVLSSNLREPVCFELHADNQKDRVLLPVPKGDDLPARSVPLRIDEITAVLSDRHYLNIICRDRTLRIRLRLQDMQALLPQERFFCPCRGILLNLSQIRGLRGQDVLMKDGSCYPIARSRRRDVLRLIRKALAAEEDSCSTRSCKP